LLDRGAAFDILKQRAHRDARAAEYPRAAHDAGAPFLRLAAAPLQLGRTLLRIRSRGKRRNHAMPASPGPPVTPHHVTPYRGLINRVRVTFPSNNRLV
jgi:hypothetical protein